MRMKVTHSIYSEELGVSAVTINTPYGSFVGATELVEEDKPFASEIRGGRIAEMRAELQAFKAQLKDERTKLKGAVNLYKSIKNYKDADKVTLHYMKKQIDIQHNKVVNLSMQVEDIKEAINKLCHYDMTDFHAKYNSKAK